MTQAQFSLCWGGHKRNVCTGLSSLQQNGEFVDMTLAADGHHVKVHQVVMALASPYIKELIASAHCQHPVILLNKISYNALSAILEYIYTGEVLVSVEHLTELLEAGRSLHIKGLEDMKIDRTEPLTQSSEIYDKSEAEREETADIDDEYFEVFEVTNPKGNVKYEDIYENEESAIEVERMDDGFSHTNSHTFEVDLQHESETGEIAQEELVNEPDTVISTSGYSARTEHVKKSNANVSVMQYTVSNQGSLQMILNRFVYYLKHTNRDGTRQWRCVDYLVGHRCPAFVITKGDVVTQRVSAHTHSFHDKKILKKVQAGAIFSAFQDAMKEGNSKKEKSKENAIARAQESMDLNLESTTRLELTQ